MSTNLIFDKTLIKSILRRLRKASDNNIVELYEYQAETDRYNLPCCIKITVAIRGIKYKSWGNGITLDEATLKAIAELLERLSCTNLHPIYFQQNGRFFRKEYSLFDLRAIYNRSKNWIGKTSSGFAIHSNFKEAKCNAVAELIERHVVLKAIAYKISPKEFPAPKCLKGFKLPKGFSLSFYNWIGPLKHYVTVCKINDPYGQTMYSFGASKSIQSSMNKSFLEATGMIIAAYKRRGNLFVEVKDHDVNMDSIRNFHLSKTNSEFLTILDASPPHIPHIDTHIKKTDFYIGECCFPSFLGDISPLVSVRAVSPITQPLFFDYWNNAVINPVAIELEKNEHPKDLHIIV